LPWKACRSAAGVVGAQALADEADLADEAGPVRRPREVNKGRAAAVRFAALAKTLAPVNKVNKMEAGNLAADADEDCLAGKAA
jgi:hypothetical protein